MLFWVTVNTHIWKCDEAMMFDKIALNPPNRSIEISIDWSQYKLKSDKLHIRESEFERFAREFVEKIARHNPPSPLLILTDSTIDYYNDEQNCANKFIEELLLEKNIVAHIDAICGSGFVAESQNNNHIHRRLKRGISHYAPESIMLMAGWNDIGLAHTQPALVKVLSTIEDYFTNGIRSIKK